MQKKAAKRKAKAKKQAPAKVVKKSPAVKRSKAVKKSRRGTKPPSPKATGKGTPVILAAGLAATKEGGVRSLPPRQRLFVAEYLANKLNAKQAAIAAGYSPKTAESQASRLLRNVKVSAAIAEAVAPTLERLEVTKEYVLETIVSMVEHCKHIPVTYRGIPLPGEYTVDALGVLRGAELLGKHLKLFTDKVVHSFDLSDLDDAEIDERLAKLGVKKK